MAAIPWTLQNAILEQPGPKLVPPPKSPQATVSQQQATQRVKVELPRREGRPKQTLLGTVNHADFRVVKPIRVHVDVRGKMVIAEWRDISEFGTGNFMTQACDDLGHTIVELYEALEKDQSRLGPDLARVWTIVKEHVARR